jgi:hypothetical protein
MSGYSERGAARVEDAGVEDPPAVDEILERQRIEHPDQARASTMQLATTREEAATADAGGAVVDLEPDGGLDIEGPNSA